MSSWKTLYESLSACGDDDDDDIVVDGDPGCCPDEGSVKEEEEGEEEVELEMGHLSHLNSFDFKGVCDESDTGSLNADEDDGSDVDVDLVLDVLAVLFVWSSVLGECDDEEELLLFPASLPRLLLNPSMARCDKGTSSVSRTETNVRFRPGTPELEPFFCTWTPFGGEFEKEDVFPSLSGFVAARRWRRASEALNRV